MQQHVLIGGLIMAMCLILVFRDRWFLTNTSKGERLIRWFGEFGGLWVLRGLLLSGIIFGGLLAMQIIRPIQW